MKTEKKSGAARTQLAVTDEQWSDERVRSFLDMQTREGEHPDFHALLRAYRGMVPETFERFVGFFVAAGRNLDQAGPDGRTLAQLIATHRHGTEYLAILKDAGAR
ncbi:MAG TPA: PA4642 family protein [Hyphomicrobiales bacterium]|nr:PA4642 family protein [Hyphomicrobiales bacterium]